VTGYLI